MAHVLEAGGGSGADDSLQHVADTLERTALESGDRLLPFFQFTYLAPEQQKIASCFASLAVYVVGDCKGSPERTVCLRKLLEAKDAALRAKQE